MTKLAKAVAQAMGLPVHTNATLAGEVHQGDWVELSPTSWLRCTFWVRYYTIADRLIDECKIDTSWGNGEWLALCGNKYAAHPDRKTAALMAFCKWKGLHMTELEQSILRILSRTGGLTTGSIARQCIELRDGTSYTRSARVRQTLLDMQKRGLVKPMDAAKPVCWVLV